MGIYRKFVRAKKGMSTIFGALFFIILILMGFNLMLWEFIQQDSYNSVIASMSQRDQLAVSENLEPQNPGAVQNTQSCPCSFSIKVDNVGGAAVQIVRIYITNVNPSGSSQCVSAPCIVDPSPTSNPRSFTNGNIPVAAVNYLIPVTGISLNQTGDTSSYQIVLSSSRGRLYSFAFPWQGQIPNTTIINNNGKLFQTNIGPISILFDFQNFEFTSTYPNASATKPIPAWITPSGSSLIFWIKVQNTANSSVTLAPQSGILMTAYSSSSTAPATWFLADNSTVCCGVQVKAYTLSNPIILPAANPLPSPSTFVKFAIKAPGSNVVTSTPGGSSGVGEFMLFIGFFYYLNGRFQGQTIPFVAVNDCASPTYIGSPPQATPCT